ncbi:hypothetical protein BC937DRAFT_92063 [Endogone sp. FLAS-F59071]|nr:hypothetical protein BC937DRAFT_92063 [Endogone sp. FLAS-F59071]|eukprot:RUS23130.1 hypothetical protein BC937DRAFT_92063 [Endogone sp. FLAS-F59071]
MDQTALSQEPWAACSAQDLEVLSDIISLATQTARSKTAEATSFINLFRAYDAVLRTRRPDPSTDALYYRTWEERFEKNY